MAQKLEVGAAGDTQAGDTQAACNSTTEIFCPSVETFGSWTIFCDLAEATVTQMAAPIFCNPAAAIFCTSAEAFSKSAIFCNSAEATAESSAMANFCNTAAELYCASAETFCSSAIFSNSWEAKHAQLSGNTLLRLNGRRFLHLA